ncbi:MAG: DNA transposition AAA+ family ATPase [Parvicella sp.]|jgi:DNA transposition AAA+ family ATPase
MDKNYTQGNDFIADIRGSAVVDINTQVEILKKVMNKLMITFDDEGDRMDYILDICNEYRKEAEKQYTEPCIGILEDPRYNGKKLDWTKIDEAGQM